MAAQLYQQLDSSNWCTACSCAGVGVFGGVLACLLIELCRRQSFLVDEEQIGPLMMKEEGRRWT